VRTTGSALRRRVGALSAALIVTALALAGCTPAPAEGQSPSTTTTAPVVLPCIVSDPEGGNPVVPLAFDGVRQAADELGVRFEESPAATAAAVPAALDDLASKGCTVVVTVGERALVATTESARAHPDVAYVWVDDSGAEDASAFPELADAPNVTPVLFDLTQTAFLAGYLAAGMTKTGVVGTFGDAEEPTSTTLMDAFAQGVEHFNAMNPVPEAEPVRVVGWDRQTRQGEFLVGTGGEGSPARAVQALLDEEADVLLPVRMPSAGMEKYYKQIAGVLEDSAPAVSIIGVGSDVFETAPDASGSVLTSLVAGADVGVYGLVLAAAHGRIAQPPFLGTLANNGVDLAPYHDWSDRVPENLAADVDLLEADVIAGDVDVDASPRP